MLRRQLPGCMTLDQWAAANSLKTLLQRELPDHFYGPADSDAKTLQQVLAATEKWVLDLIHYIMTGNHIHVMPDSDCLLFEQQIIRLSMGIRRNPTAAAYLIKCYGPRSSCEVTNVMMKTYIWLQKLLMMAVDDRLWVYNKATHTFMLIHGHETCPVDRIPTHDQAFDAFAAAHHALLRTSASPLIPSGLPKASEDTEAAANDTIGQSSPDIKQEFTGFKDATASTARTPSHAPKQSHVEAGATSVDFPKRFERRVSFNDVDEPYNKVEQAIIDEQLSTVNCKRIGGSNKLSLAINLEERGVRLLKHDFSCLVKITVDRFCKEYGLDRRDNEKIYIHIMQFKEQKFFDKFRFRVEGGYGFEFILPQLDLKGPSNGQNTRVHNPDTVISAKSKRRHSHMDDSEENFHALGQSTADEEQHAEPLKKKSKSLRYSATLHGSQALTEKRRTEKEDVDLSTTCSDTEDDTIETMQTARREHTINQEIGSVDGSYLEAALSKRAAEATALRGLLRASSGLSYEGIEKAIFATLEKGVDPEEYLKAQAASKTSKKAIKKERN